MPKYMVNVLSLKEKKSEIAASFGNSAVGYETEGSRQQQKIEGHRNKVKAADEDMMATQVLAGEWHNTGIRLYRDSPWWMTSCSFRKVGAWTVVGCLRMVFDVAGVVKETRPAGGSPETATGLSYKFENFCIKLNENRSEKDELLKRIVPARQGMKLWILRMFEDRSVENTSDFGSEDIEIHREEAQPRFSHVEEYMYENTSSRYLEGVCASTQKHIGVDEKSKELTGTSYGRIRKIEVSTTYDVYCGYKDEMNNFSVLETVEEQLMGEAWVSELDATVLRGQSLTEPPLAAHIFDQNHSPVVSQSRWEMCLTRSFTIRSRIFIKSTRAMKTTGPTAQPPTHSYETVWVCETFIKSN
ncbi:hypothetical protein BY996DRAFT_6527329 [Phakopsora pachyrhizi]|nr:hypothetical protein BY996DRAFT_6527329 [Phakopsora pachyrhizi]